MWFGGNKDTLSRVLGLFEVLEEDEWVEHYECMSFSREVVCRVETNKRKLIFRVEVEEDE